MAKPVRGGRLAELRPFVNVRTEAGWVLLQGYLCACLRPIGPYPVLAETGEQGSATSTARHGRGGVLAAQSEAVRAPVSTALSGVSPGASVGRGD